MGDVIANLRERSNVIERMDTDCVDFADYQRCLSDLAQVNVITLTHRPIISWLAQETKNLRCFSLLDVGCGQGDLLRRIRRWALRRRIEARLEGLDRNPWSIRAATEATPADNAVSWHVGDVFAFHPEQPFDFIVSSQFTHHLSDSEVVAFLGWQEATARRGWIIADLHRHWFAYYGFPLLARLARWHRFVRMDGQVSIARSLTVPEWRGLIAATGITGDISVTRYLPSRLCVARRCHR